MSPPSSYSYEFDSAIVAKAQAMDTADVEEQLDRLDRVHGYVRRVKEHEFPDRTLTLRYRFVHTEGFETRDLQEARALFRGAAPRERVSARRRTDFAIPPAPITQRNS